MTLFNPNRHLWAITGWFARAQARGYGFALWASPEFMSAAREFPFDEEAIQRRGCELIRTAGFAPSSGTRPFTFRDRSLDCFEVPGDGTCMTSEPNPAGGTSYRPHNVDTPGEQAALMALWFFWSQEVEQFIYDRNRPAAGAAR